MKLPLFALAAVVAVGLAAPADAQQTRTCVVSDPTGTQLNVRDEPNGRIVGSIANGVWVKATLRTTSRGKAWVYIFDSGPDGGPDIPLGWVFAAYLTCR